MITVNLPADLERQFEDLAAKAGKTPEACAQEAVLEYLQDLEDYFIAEERMKNFDPSTASTLEDVEKELGLAD
jgi:RHH-type rel operon transcriptional repressor/antitoxin RelB